MPKFGPKSLERLATCDERLQRIFNKVITIIDCSVTDGYRDRKAQEEALHRGTSTKAFGQSLHNVMPSKAIDVCPYPIDYEDRERFVYFAAFVLGVAEEMGITLRWGGDWNRNHNLKDQKLFDLPHFELVD